MTGLPCRLSGIKTIDQMLRWLAQPEVTEVALVAGRLPCARTADVYRPIEQVAPSNDDILAMLVSAGGSRYVEDLGPKPVQWTTRIEGLGAVVLSAVQRDDVVQVKARLATPGAPPRAPDSVAAPPPAPSPLAVAAPSPPAVVAPSPLAVVAPSPPAVAAPSPPAVAALDRELELHLDEARSADASDLHIVAERPPLFRVARELLPRGDVLPAATVERMLRSVVPPRLEARLATEGSCDFALGHERLGRFRVNVSRQRTGLKGSFRLIAREVPSLEALGLPAAIADAAHHHQGLVVLTGPSGHGKTTTLAALVELINATTTHHVITVEDPIEHLLPRRTALLSQREVGTHTRSFASALKGALREDPDVIVVGELRDPETVRMALAASETGHLVLGTMNTPSAAKTIDRLIDLFPPADQGQVRMTLAGGLRMIVSQRLLPATGGGMVAAAELLPGSVPLWSLIRDGRTFQIPSLQQRGKAIGILRLDESLTELVRAGRVSRDVAKAEMPELDIK